MTADKKTIKTLSKFNSARRECSLLSEETIFSTSKKIALNQKKVFFDVIIGIFDEEDEVVTHAKASSFIRGGFKSEGKKRALLELMEDTGFITQSRSKKDKRIVQVRLTKKSELIVRDYYSQLLPILKHVSKFL